MRSVFLAAAVLALAASATAAPADGAHDMSAAHGAMTMAEGQGAVVSVNAAAGTVTIHHGPIAALNWPAMTMAFKATPPSILHGVKAGQQVTFQLMQMNGATTITSIKAK